MIGKQVKNSGVSPVVGVILMVAVTVILAAVIGSFVLDLGGSVSQSAQAGVSFDEDVGSNQIDVQLTTVQAADSIWVNATSVDTAQGTDGYEGGVSGAASPAFDSSAEVDSSLIAQQFLLSRSTENGGPGTIVTVYGSGDGQISVIGEVDGESTVIQTFEYDYS